ncbi:hypothetical protein BCR41DRAFT_397918 [Lobosporangium transversale]|uniref:Uncharacterized protein n=1 Tax=Lobosporangium transversale TaxID=64571 RepID=A0A1Y2GH59_9FUNG|nr:hypothetical protein BCR41DRAFT_398093 [Lobosporangium transversale]XP_021879874.1 hypothetical protein BCR41DRAFT_397918 [Lobosporangium transversale]ORZ10917.1 hypothetical protein BCR41DRAFT_398093 [Lobosporangium transversale]ORZ11777.1 hypothetical protein BCR41DRAFT_397918 [Lobosporangium transversale]|eukprot:XP_021879434.1 hypothetical protein BCR41DRAFT_398093 [Lobosporangium transversale]
MTGTSWQQAFTLSSMSAFCKLVQSLLHRRRKFRAYDVVDVINMYLTCELTNISFKRQFESHDQTEFDSFKGYQLNGKDLHREVAHQGRLQRRRT